MGTDCHQFADALGRIVVGDTPEERQEGLLRACADDAGLRFHLKKLLWTETRTGGLLETAVSPASAEGPGDVLDRYRLVYPIGEGGFAVVYLAELEPPEGRSVALKIIKKSMNSQDVMARFETERRAMVLMDHPNIAHVLDVGVTPTGRPYFVMELLNGIPITAYCDRHHLPVPERLDLFLQVCHAMHHAHQKAIIHCDLKPSNILVSKEEGKPLAKVIDFGIAKALGASHFRTTPSNQAHQMIGTPSYMSPEQTAGQGEDVDLRSDIYSLGVVLYELLTGRTPVDGRTLRGAGPATVHRLICEGQTPVPSTRLRLLNEKLPDVAHHRQTDPSSLTREITGNLDWIVMKALAKAREQRYRTVPALSEDLQRHLNHQPARADSLTRRGIVL